MSGKKAIELVISFWLLIVAVQFLYRTPFLADSSTNYSIIYYGMAVITVCGAVKAFMDYRNGGEAAKEAVHVEKTDRRARRSRRGD